MQDKMIVTLSPNGRALIETIGRLERPEFDEFLKLVKSSGVFRYNPELRSWSSGDLEDAARWAASKGISVSAKFAAEMNKVKESAIIADSKSEELVEEALKNVTRTLYGYQKEGVKFLLQNSSAILADEMGLGKTLQAITAWDQTTGLVVICPGVVKGAWKREIEKSLKNKVEIEILTGRSESRIAPTAGQAVVINFEILPEKWEISDKLTVVVDEAHRAKSTKSKIFQKLETLLSNENVSNKWLLTATPILNRKAEFGSLAYLLGKLSVLGVKKPQNVEFVANKKLALSASKFMLRRLADEVLDLPEITRQIQKAEIKLPKSLKKEMDELLASMEKLSEKIVFEKMEAIRSALCQAKIESALEWIEDFREENPEKNLVVFSAHTSALDAIKSKFENCRKIDGSINNEEKTETENWFQSEKDGRIIAANIKAGGVGITLTNSHYCLFVELDWTPALNMQAEARLRRIGQKSSVLVTILESGHELETRINEKLIEKMNLIDATVNKVSGQKAVEKRFEVVETLQVKKIEEIVVDKKNYDKINNFLGENKNLDLRTMSFLGSLKDNCKKYELTSRQIAAFEKIVAEMTQLTEEQKVECKNLHEKICYLANMSQDGTAEKNEVGFSLRTINQGFRLSVKNPTNWNLADLQSAREVVQIHRKQVG